MRVSISILIGLSLLAAVLAAPVPQEEKEENKSAESDGSQTDDAGHEERTVCIHLKDYCNGAHIAQALIVH